MLRVSGNRVVTASVMCVLLVLTLFVMGCPDRVAVPPDASFEGKPSTGTPPLKVQFTDTSKPGTSPIHSWLWEFGDGMTSTQRNPSHLYYEPGGYTVSLTVTTAVSPASKFSAPHYVMVKEATIVARVGPNGGAIEANGTRLSIPQGALENPVIIGIAAGDGEVPVDPSAQERLVSEVFSIAHDQDDFFVDVRSPLTLEIPFIAQMVPAEDRTGAKLEVLAKQEDGLTLPILGEVEGAGFVAALAGLPHRASYAVVYRPQLVLENIPIDEPERKAGGNPMSYHWGVKAWRVCYTEPMLQALTALRVGTFSDPMQYDRRDFSESELAESLSDLRMGVREMHTSSGLAGFISPALLISPGNEYTLILHNVNEPPRTSYQRVTEVTFATSIYGDVVIDPAQLIAITKRNSQRIPGEREGLYLDRIQKLDFSNAFAQEMFRAIFRGYDYPKFVKESVADLDANGNPRMIPYYQGFEDGIATFVGQVASAYHQSLASPTGEYVLMARSLGDNEYSTFGAPLFAPSSLQMPGYSYASQDFFFYVGRRFPDMAPGTMIPQALVFIADSYEGVLELIRAREAEAEVTSYDEAVHQANIACDLAMRKTFNKSLADVYWDHARGRAYENDENNALRPSDSEREPFTFNEDRFNSDTVARYTFTRNEETAVISYDTAPMVLRDIPPLSTRAVILSASGVSGDVVVSVNAFDWAPDLAGNSMRVKIYEDGSDGEELNAQQAQVVLSGLGIPDGFSRAIVVFSNVTMDKSYSAALIATMKAVPIEEPMGLLAGLVTKGGTDNALAGVDVIVNRRIGDFVGAQLSALKTDSLGIYYFPLLPVGDIQITFTKDGYLTAKRNATVTARKLTVVSAALFPIE